MKDENKHNIEKTFSESYTADSLGGEVGLQGVRLSPSQYLGSRSVRGAIQALIELLQNGVDEGAAKIAFYLSQGIPLTDIPKTQIMIEIFKDDSARVTDTGRGVPVAISNKFGRPVVEAAFEEINVGGKGKGYVEKGNSAYAGASVIGKHGSGAACANATSDFFIVDTYPGDGNHYQVEWNKAVKTKPCHIVGPDNGIRGTSIHFRPSKEVFDLWDDSGKELERFYHFNFFKELLTEYAYNTENIVYILKYQNEDDTWQELKLDSNEFIPIDRIKNGIKGDIHELSIKDVDLQFEINLLIGVSSSNQILLTCNMLKMTRGTPIASLGEALEEIYPDIVDVLNARLASNKITRNVSERIIKEMGVGSLINYIKCYMFIKMSEPEYTGQVKEELTVPKIREPLKLAFRKELKEGSLVGLRNTLIEHISGIAWLRIEQSINAEKEKERKKKQEELRKAKEDIKKESLGKVKGMANHEKNIIHARSDDLSKVVMYVVEGLSAKSNLQRIRDVNTETIFALSQRPVNVFNYEPQEVLKLKKGIEMYKAFEGNGSGNYKAIVIMTDPDGDGALIRMYVIAFLVMFFPKYLNQGRVFIVDSPKYSATDGTEYKFFTKIEDRNKFMMDHQTWKTSSYKGIGSITKDAMRQLLSSKDYVIRIKKEDLAEGLQILKGFMSDTSFKQKLVLGRYGSNELKNHVHSRKELLKHQEIEFDVNELEVQYSTTPDMSDVRKGTNLEEFIKSTQTSSINEDDEELNELILDDLTDEYDE